MTGFDASTAVDPLDYNFNPYVDFSGTIPEPSEAAIDQYRDELMALFHTLGLDPEVIKSGRIPLERMDELLKKGADVQKATVASVSRLTGIPADKIDALPFRVKARFMGWITGSFTSGEAAAPATT